MSKPHTCPTCGGTGQRCVFYTVYVRCESCGGSGIVWEPQTPPRPITVTNEPRASLAGPV